MDRFIQLVVDGIAIGSIYGALALALVLIFRSTVEAAARRSAISPRSVYLTAFDSRFRTT